MPTTKVDRIQDEKLRDIMAAAHASLRSGDYLDVVRRAADTYLELLRRKPELLAEGGFMARMRIMSFPRLGARLEREEGKEPEVQWDREKFGFAEAVTYFEFAVDSLVREGL
ncbi:MAG: hypothetical protein WBD55_06595 [Dehalococcoidia bacterium]